MATIKNKKYREPDDYIPASIQKEMKIGKYAPKKTAAKKTTTKKKK